jgi:uncharacterized protein YndB with AHSA1/START domain
MAEPGVIRHTQRIAYPPSRVWQALTDPALQAAWWAAGEVRPEVGHRFTMDMGGWGEQPCTVLSVEPERTFSYTFGEGTLDTIITWWLQPEGEGTLLSLEHAGFDLDSPFGDRAFHGMDAGWPTVLARIEPALAAAPPRTA